MLLDLIDESVISLDIDVKNHEEAIRQAGSLLVKAKKVNEEYVQEMVNVSNSIKGYIVLAPGIAMPHARPECGVNEIGISICTLNTPIEFGNKANDPVKLVVALAAKDSKTHLELLQELSLVLGDDEIVDKLCSCENKVDVLKALEKYVK